MLLQYWTEKNSCFLKEPTSRKVYIKAKMQINFRSVCNIFHMNTILLTLYSSTEITFCYEIFFISGYIIFRVYHCKYITYRFAYYTKGNDIFDAFSMLTVYICNVGECSLSLWGQGIFLFVLYGTLWKGTRGQKVMKHDYRENTNQHKKLAHHH